MPEPGWAKQERTLGPIISSLQGKLKKEYRNWFFSGQFFFQVWRNLLRCDLTVPGNYLNLQHAWQFLCIQRHSFSRILRAGCDWFLTEGFSSFDWGIRRRRILHKMGNQLKCHWTGMQKGATSLYISAGSNHPGGGGGTATYGQDRYVPLWRVWFSSSLL